METTEILERLDDISAGHPDGYVASAAMEAATRIRELRDQLADAEMRAQKVREIA